MGPRGRHESPGGANPTAGALMQLTQRRLANAIRALAMDAVEAANSGHPGMPMGMVPIVEPEVSIKSPERDAADRILLQEILKNLDAIPDGQQVMLKLTIPAESGLFQPLIDHPKVLRVVALSGGFSRDEACRELAKNPGMIASFSRALLSDLRHGQSDDEFHRTLGTAIDEIYEASTATVPA